MLEKDEAEAALALLRALGDKRRLASALREIAKIMTNRGDFGAALAYHQERAAIIADAGDPAGRAACLSDIARIMTQTGQANAALHVHQEALRIFEEHKDDHGRAVVLGDIARIMRVRGEIGAALERHQEQLRIFQSLGDLRSWAVVLGDIAEIMRNSGEVDEALRLQHERLQVNRQLEDQDGIAAANAAIGQIYLADALKTKNSESFRLARESLTESYGIVLASGRLDGIAFVGRDLAQVLIESREFGQARILFEQSRDGFRKLGYRELAANIDAQLQKLEDG